MCSRKVDNLIPPANYTVVLRAGRRLYIARRASRAASSASTVSYVVGKAENKAPQWRFAVLRLRAADLSEFSIIATLVGNLGRYL